MPTDTRSAAEQLLEALACANAKCRCHVALRRGHGKTHCPVHSDVAPSFGVDVKNDVLLVNCYANCDQSKVMDALKGRNLWPEKTGSAKVGREIIAEYDYRDESGKLLYQAVREVPKDFKQRRPDPKNPGKWIWSLEDTRRVLYRLPELLESTKNKRVIFIVEGEKDVDRLRALGLTATCNVGGSGKWRSEYNPYFAGQLVCIVLDNDDSGYRHGLEIARSLVPVAERVWWLELPGLDAGGDVSDWLDDNNDNVDQLKLLARNAPAAKDKIDAAGIKTETLFRKEGLLFRFEPSQAPMSFTFGRFADHREELTAEVHVTRAGKHVLRRRVNLLSGGRGSMSDLAKELFEEYDQLDSSKWKQIVGEGAELVIEAQRNGVVVETVEGEIQKPAAIRWLCDGLILENKPNCWLASAGTGKSTLAQALCVYHAAGFRFLNRETKKGVPLYLDWEDDREAYESVIYDVCRNLGVWPVPRMLYINMKGRRLSDQVEKLGQVIAQNDITLMVIDAVAAASGSPGEHSSWESVALQMEEAFGQLPPVSILALDHVTSDEHKNGDRVPVKARGAERKVEFFRNQWSLMIDKDARERGRHLVDWTHTKLNRGGNLRPAFVTELLHRPGDLGINELGIDASPSAVERLQMVKRIQLALLRAPGMTVAEVTAAVGRDASRSALESTRRELKRAETRGLVRQEPDSKWYAIPSEDVAGVGSPTAEGVQTSVQTTPYWAGLEGEPGGKTELPWG